VTEAIPFRHPERSVLREVKDLDSANLRFFTTASVRRRDLHRQPRPSLALTAGEQSNASGFLLPLRRSG
jgi:hypothetical protein